MQKKVSLLLLFPLILLFAACSLDYGEAELTEELESSIPDSVIMNFQQTVIENGRPFFRIYAAEASVFNQRHETVLEGVWFQEFDEEGVIVSEGSAENAVFYSETENADLEGEVYVYSDEQEVAIFAETLLWERETRSMTTRDPEDGVVVERNDGTAVQGTGFQGNFSLNEITFSGPVTGEYVQEDDEEEGDGDGQEE
ncbi:MAG: LPS export ABC transporter periplasmic protein LptC [Spirochaetia bacterium]